MRKLGVFLFVLSLATAVQAQEKKTLFSCMAQNNILNHMDVGVSVGTVGFGIDVAVPVTDYVRIRAGYSYMPPITFHSNFPIETSGGGKASYFINKFGKLNEMLPEGFIDFNLPYYKTEKELIQAYENGDFEAKDYVAIGMKPNMHHFKLLVDVLPFKNNKHWSFTAGFFVGSSTVGEAFNREGETPLLKAVNLYNERYYKEYVLNDFTLKYVNENGEQKSIGEYKTLTNFVKGNGMAGFYLGKFDDGKKAMMVPHADNTVRAEMEVSKFRPYVGFGYNTHLSRNKKWNLNVDAGILFICGTPKVYVDNVYKIDTSTLNVYLDENGYSQYVSGMGVFKYENGEYPDEYYGDIVRYYYDETHDPNEWYGLRDDVQLLNHVDLVHDLHDMPSGKVRDMVDLIKKVKIYPNLSVTVSYKLF